MMRECLKQTSETFGSFGEWARTHPYTLTAITGVILYLAVFIYANN